MDRTLKNKHLSRQIAKKFRVKERKSPKHASCTRRQRRRNNITKDPNHSISKCQKIRKKSFKKMENLSCIVSDDTFKDAQSKSLNEVTASKRTVQEVDPSSFIKFVFVPGDAVASSDTGSTSESNVICSLQRQNKKITLEKSESAPALETVSRMVFLAPDSNVYRYFSEASEGACVRTISVSFNMLRIPVATEGAAFGFVVTRFDIEDIGNHVDLNAFEPNEEYYGISTGGYSKQVRVLNKGVKDETKQLEGVNIKSGGVQEIEFEFVWDESKETKEKEEEDVCHCNVYLVELEQSVKKNKDMLRGWKGKKENAEKKKHLLKVFKNLKREGRNIMMYYCHSSYFVGEKSEILCKTECATQFCNDV